MSNPNAAGGWPAMPDQSMYAQPPMVENTFAANVAPNMSSANQWAQQPNIDPWPAMPNGSPVVEQAPLAPDMQQESRGRLARIKDKFAGFAGKNAMNSEFGPSDAIYGDSSAHEPFALAPMTTWRKEAVGDALTNEAGADDNSRTAASVLAEQQKWLGTAASDMRARGVDSVMGDSVKQAFYGQRELTSRAAAEASATQKEQAVAAVRTRFMVRGAQLANRISTFGQKDAANIRAAEMQVINALREEDSRALDAARDSSGYIDTGWGSPLSQDVIARFNATNEFYAALPEGEPFSGSAADRLMLDPYADAARMGNLNGILEQLPQGLQRKYMQQDTLHM